MRVARQVGRGHAIADADGVDPALVAPVLRRARGEQVEDAFRFRGVVAGDAVGDVAVMADPFVAVLEVLRQRQGGRQVEDREVGREGGAREAGVGGCRQVAGVLLALAEDEGAARPCRPGRAGAGRRSRAP